MAGRGPRVGATGLVGLLGLVLAFIVTFSLPFLGLPWFIISAAAIGGATYGVHRRLNVQLVTHNDIDAFTKQKELVALSRMYGLLTTGDLETLRARLHDFVDGAGTPGGTVRVPARALFPSLGPPKVKPVRIPSPSEIERIGSRERWKSRLSHGDDRHYRRRGCRGRGVRHLRGKRRCTGSQPDNHSGRENNRQAGSALPKHLRATGVQAEIPSSPIHS